MADLIERLRAAGQDERLSTGTLYLEAADETAELRALLAEARPVIALFLRSAEARLDHENESEPYFTLKELLARIDAKVKPCP